MAGPITGTKSEFVYNSDNGASYHVLHSNAKAAAGGFGIGPASGGNFPKTWRMRYVRGVITGSGGADTAPATITLPVADASNPLMTGGSTTFTVTYPWGSLTYTVTGVFGEKRRRLATA